MIHFFKDISIRRKLLLLFIVVSGIVLSAAFTIIVRMDATSSRESLISSVSVAGEIVAERSSASLAFFDMESANKNLRSLRSHDSIVFACIRTSENDIFAEFVSDATKGYMCDEYLEEKQTAFEDLYVNIYKPVLLDNQPLGMVHIKADLKGLNEQIAKSAQLSFAIFVGLMIVSALIMRRSMSLITKPIMQLKDLAQEVTEKGNYDVRMQKTSNDEVGSLVVSFNNMLEQISLRDKDLIKEKEKAQSAAEDAERMAQETEQVNHELESEIHVRKRIEEELQDLNETLEEKVQERTAELKELNEKIGDIARSAGMAEVASGVLHNVGNVLNSVNVSASLIREHVRKSKSDNLARLVEMLDQHQDRIGEFITHDEKGKQIPKFLSLLSEQLNNEKANLFKELDELANNIDHIKNVISMQQSYAGSYGVREKVHLADLMEDALKINMEGMARYSINVQKQYEEVPLLYIDKHKILQIIINLISNAKHALIDSAAEQKTLYVSVCSDNGFAVIEVKDNGVGIAEEDIQHLFEYGFKKRKEGHGYGLHHSALVANELGGKIQVWSDGLGKGARFSLFVPIEEQAVA